MTMLGFAACSTESESENADDSLAKEAEATQRADKLLDDIAGPPQTFSGSSDKPFTVTGARGTIVAVDPSALETIDGSPLGSEIKVELRELIEPGELIANRTPTVSGDRLLETGGAYYLGMSSDGKPLRIKEGEGLMVEFPRLSEQDMELFIGQRDHGGMVDWSPLEEKIAPKKLEEPKMPTAEKNGIEEMVFNDADPRGGVPDSSSGDMQDLIAFLEGKGKSQPGKKKTTRKMSKEEQRKARQEYQKQLKEFEVANKTYQALRVVRLGLINCDRFIEDDSPKSDLILASSSDILIGRAFAVFYEYNSVVNAEFRNIGEQCENCEQQAPLSRKFGIWKVPLGQKVKIVAIGSSGDSPQYFENDVVIADNQALEVNFSPVSQVDLERKLVALNRFQ